MKKGIIIGLVMVLFLVSVFNPVSAWKPPSSYDPPVITNINPTSSYNVCPATITITCVVEWDPATFQRYVWLYAEGDDSTPDTRYTMYYQSTVSPNKYRYSITIEVNPWQRVYWYLKARAIISYEYISLDTRYPSSGSYSFSPIAEDSYSKSSSDKWAIIIQGTKNNGGNDYYAHKDAYDDMCSRVASSDFLTSKTKKLDLSSCLDKDIGYSQVVNALSYPDDHGADSTDFIFIYIVCHGNGNGIAIINERIMTFGVIDGILDDTSFDRLTIVFESCNSGECYDDLAGNNRLIITSDDGDHLSKIVDDGANSYCPFSNKFISLLGSKTFGYAFYSARAYVYSLWLVGTLTGSFQSPLLNYNSRASYKLGC